MELINQINLINNDLIVTTLFNTLSVKELLSIEEFICVINKKEDFESDKTKLLISNSKKDTENNYYLILDISNNEKVDIELIEYFNKNFIWNTFRRVLLVTHKQLHQWINYFLEKTFLSFSSMEYSLNNL